MLSFPLLVSPPSLSVGCLSWSTNTLHPDKKQVFIYLAESFRLALCVFRRLHDSLLNPASAKLAAACEKRNTCRNTCGRVHTTCHDVCSCICDKLLRAGFYFTLPWTSLKFGSGWLIMLQNPKCAAVNSEWSNYFQGPTLYKNMPGRINILYRYNFNQLLRKGVLQDTGLESSPLWCHNDNALCQVFIPPS